MGSDMVVALSRATAGCALFGHNCQRPVAEVQTLVCKRGRTFSPGEGVRLRHVEMPQVRQTCTVLASRPAGLWGYHHGVNEHGVAVGLTHIPTRMHAAAPGLDGHELTRLALERGISARHAVDLLTDMVSRHGQQALEADSDKGLDNAFLVADGREAFVLETAGTHWAEQEVKEVHAVGGLCHLRQDWDRISCGLADLLIERGWWPKDGTKVDFAAALGLQDEDHLAAVRRWGRATLRLEEHNGKIDVTFLRRLLASTEDGLCRLPQVPDDHGTAASLIAELGTPQTQVPMAWVALGPPSLSVFFPVCLAGDLPAVFADPRQGGLWRRLRRLRTHDRLHAGGRALLAGLQAHFDQLAGEFKEEAAALHQRGESEVLRRLATSLMEHAVERCAEACDSLAEAEAVQVGLMAP